MRRRDELRREIAAERVRIEVGRRENDLAHARGESGPRFGRFDQRVREHAVAHAVRDQHDVVRPRMVGDVEQHALRSNCDQSALVMSTG